MDCMRIEHSRVIVHSNTVEEFAVLGERLRKAEIGLMSIGDSLLLLGDRDELDQARVIGDFVCRMAAKGKKIALVSYNLKDTKEDLHMILRSLGEKEPSEFEHWKINEEGKYARLE